MPSTAHALDSSADPPEASSRQALGEPAGVRSGISLAAAAPRWKPGNRGHLERTLAGEQLLSGVPVAAAAVRARLRSAGRRAGRAAIGDGGPTAGRGDDGGGGRAGSGSLPSGAVRRRSPPVIRIGGAGPAGLVARGCRDSGAARTG